MESKLLQLAIGLYLAALVAYLIGFTTKSKQARTVATYLAWLGIVSQLVIFIMRGMQAGHFPLVSMYEFLSAFAWMVALSYLIFAWRYTGPVGGIQAAGVTTLILTVALLGYAHSLPPHMKQIESLMPVLRSNWLAIHISTAVIGYGAAGLGSAFACLYFIRRAAGAEKGWLSERLPSAAVLDAAVYKSIRFAFPFLSLLNITGAVWAYYAWGRYWGWDPKETWSLITWLIYLFYLHARLRASWRPPRLNAIILAGLAAIMFTFLGVNQLAAFSESLHSYASGG